MASGLAQEGIERTRGHLVLGRGHGRSVSRRRQFLQFGLRRPFERSKMRRKVVTALRHTQKDASSE